MAVELDLVEQRYRAVLEVLNDGASVTLEAVVVPASDGSRARGATAAE